MVEVRFGVTLEAYLEKLVVGRESGLSVLCSRQDSSFLVILTYLIVAVFATLWVLDYATSYPLVSLPITR